MGPTEYHDITAQTMIEPSPCRVSLFESGIPDLMFSSHKLFLKEQHEGRLTSPCHLFPVVWRRGFIVVTSSFRRLNISFSNCRRFSNCSTAYSGCWVCEAHVG
jgi:hypothetical protein